MSAHRLIIGVLIYVHVRHRQAKRILHAGVQRDAIVSPRQILPVDEHTGQISVAFDDRSEIASPSIGQTDQRKRWQVERD